MPLADRVSKCSKQSLFGTTTAREELVISTSGVWHPQKSWNVAHSSFSPSPPDMVGGVAQTRCDPGG